MPEQVFRTRCPFYGFDFGYQTNQTKMFIDQQGNRCPLRRWSGACIMERLGKYPDWKKCPYNLPTFVREELLVLLDTAKISPREFALENREDLRCIPFKTWYTYIVEGKRLS